MKVGICEALAIIKQRNHTTDLCRYPLAIKRWDGHDDNFPENEMWFDCLGANARGIIMSWTASPTDWAKWEVLAERCFYEVNNSTRFVESNPLLINCDYEDPRIQRSVLKAVYKHGTVPYSKAVRCVKPNRHLNASYKFSVREWEKMRRKQRSAQQREAGTPAMVSGGGRGG